MKVYFSSPGNAMQAEALRGQYVLESFAIKAKSAWMQRYRPTFAGMMIDSGAFSFLTTGVPIDLGEYIAYCQQHGRMYDLMVNLDVISGDVTDRVDQSKKNLQTMRDAGIDALPVFHQGEPWSVLEELAAGGKVGIGCQRPMRGIRSFLDGVFSRIPSNCYVHAFALANVRYTAVFPFSSVDGSTWWHELVALMSLKGQGSDVLRFLTQGELLELVLKKYQRMPKALAWAGPLREVGTMQLPGLGDDDEEADQ